MQIPSVQITHSSVAGSVPDAADLEIGALAVNVTDDVMYTKDYTGTIKLIRGETGNSTIASAATLDLSTTGAGVVDVTGTTTVTAITLPAGHTKTLRFAGALTLTNGASLVLLGGANVTTAAGDFAVMRGFASGVVRCMSYSFASTPVADIAALTHAATSKTTPVDADELPLVDSAASNVLKKLTWANLKATLKTYFDTLYGAIAGSSSIVTVGALNSGSITSGFGAIDVGTDAISGGTLKAATTMGVGAATPSVSGAGISFPVTQSASTDANTLDDYEEGTWTPTLNATSGTITANASFTKGAYTKVGRLVTLTGYVYVTSVSTPTGTFTIGGAPFATASGYEFRTAGCIYAADWKTTATTSITCFMVGASSTIYVKKFAAGVASEVAADLQADASIAFSITYMTA